MEQATILVVEDETIVAKDIQCSLQRLGYHVPSTATSGEEAIRKAGELKPDLVLMDIVLKGRMDGVETAQHLQHQFDVPVVYLTAYADHQTLDRVKTTTPAGYMLKPFQPNELRTTIELALHRSRSNRHVKESLRWLMTTVRCIHEAVVTTNRRPGDLFESGCGNADRLDATRTGGARFRSLVAGWQRHAVRDGGQSGTAGDRRTASRAIGRPVSQEEGRGDRRNHWTRCARVR